MGLLMSRLMLFRKELVQLWRAFLMPETPLHLKFLMLLVPLYLVSPIDLIPDFIPFVGFLDDIIVIPLLVGLIVSMLPQKAKVRATQRWDRTIDGDYRRM